LNEDAVTHARPHACPLCTLSATVFFQVQKEHGKASETLIHMSLRKQQEVVTASLEGNGLTIVNSIVAKATDNHGLYLCFGCATRSLPDVFPPTVPPPATTPPRRTPSGSKNLHTGLLDHVVGGCDELSDQAVPIRHALSPPLKRQQHAPKELYTVPDWNSLPKQITSLTGTPQHAGMGTCAPDCGPVPTSPHIRQLVPEKLRIITATIPHPALLIRTSARAASGKHNSWQTKYSYLVGARMWMPVIRNTMSPQFNQVSQTGNNLPAYTVYSVKNVTCSYSDNGRTVAEMSCLQGPGTPDFNLSVEVLVKAM